MIRMQNAFMFFQQILHRINRTRRIDFLLKSFQQSIDVFWRVLGQALVAFPVRSRVFDQEILKLIVDAEIYRWSHLMDRKNSSLPSGSFDISMNWNSFQAPLGPSIVRSDTERIFLAANDAGARQFHLEWMCSKRRVLRPSWSVSLLALEIYEKKESSLWWWWQTQLLTWHKQFIISTHL